MFLLINIILLIKIALYLASFALKKYHNKISQLFYYFPHDQKTIFGNLFRSDRKRWPKSLKFDINNPLHNDYIVVNATLGVSIDTSENTDNDSFFKVASPVPVREFKPKFVFELQLLILITKNIRPADRNRLSRLQGGLLSTEKLIFFFSNLSH